MSNVKKVLIVGFIGSGKSTLIDIIKENYNVEIIDTDSFAKKILKEKEYEKYARKTSLIETSDKEYFEIIRNEFHPIVVDKIKEIVDNLINVKKNDIEYIIIETALPTIELTNFVDCVIYIKNDIETKRALLKKNRNYTDELITNVINSQNIYNDLYNKADYVIENNGTILDLKEKALKIFNSIN